MIVLGRCDDTPEVHNSEIISCERERDVLLKWTELIKKEDPVEWLKETYDVSELESIMSFLSLFSKLKGQHDLKRTWVELENRFVKELLHETLFISLAI